MFIIPHRYNCFSYNCHFLCNVGVSQWPSCKPTHPDFLGNDWHCSTSVNFYRNGLLIYLYHHLVGWCCLKSNMECHTCRRISNFSCCCLFHPVLLRASSVLWLALTHLCQFLTVMAYCVLMDALVGQMITSSTFVTFPPWSICPQKSGVSANLVNFFLLSYRALLLELLLVTTEAESLFSFNTWAFWCAAFMPWTISKARLRSKLSLANSRFWVLSLFSPHTKWSWSTSCKWSLKSQCVANLQNWARYSLTVLSGCWLHQWKVNFSAITNGLGSKWFFNSFAKIRKRLFPELPMFLRDCKSLLLRDWETQALVFPQ